MVTRDSIGPIPHWIGNGANWVARQSDPVIRDVNDYKDIPMLAARPPKPFLREAAVALTLAVAIAGLASADNPTTYHAYAPPIVFGPWTKVGEHTGSARFLIIAKPVGSTFIQCEVEYFDSDGHKKVEQFPGNTPIRIKTCDCYATVRVRCKGIPTGTAVEIEVNH